MRRFLLLLALAPGLLAACEDGVEGLAGDEYGDPGLVRFIHISDLHVHGGTESPNAAHLEAAVAQLDALDFDADFVIPTGDYVDYIPDGSDPEVPGALHAAMAALDELRWPWYPVVGNHEYYRDEALQPTGDKAARDAYVAAVHGRPLDDTWVTGGVRFIVMNSMAGDRWEDSAGLVGSFTDDQLQWLREQLEGGRPSILFMHHPPTGEALTPLGDSLCAAIADYPDTVKAVFAGHLHTFWEGESCGVPYYLTANVEAEGPFYFLVEYDGATDELTIVNEAEIDFGGVPELECDPEAGELSAPEAAAGTVQAMRVGSVSTNLPGLDGLDGEGMSKFPLLLSFDAWDAATSSWPIRFTAGADQDGFAAYVDGSPCAGLRLTTDGTCALSDATALTLDAVPILEAFLDIDVEPGWKLRIDVSSLWLEARMEETDGVPVVAEGLFHLAGSGERMVDDLHGILVGEYCAGRLEGCEPGSSASKPACPTGAGSDFFDEIPSSCDLEIGGYSLRFLLLFVSNFPLEDVRISGELHTEVLPLSADPQSGFADELLFDTSAGMNCAE